MDRSYASASESIWRCFRKYMNENLRLFNQSEWERCLNDLDETRKKYEGTEAEYYALRYACACKDELVRLSEIYRNQ